MIPVGETRIDPPSPAFATHAPGLSGHEPYGLPLNVTDFFITGWMYVAVKNDPVLAVDVATYDVKGTHDVMEFQPVA